MAWKYECTDGFMRTRRNCVRVYDATGRYWYVARSEIERIAQACADGYGPVGALADMPPAEREVFMEQARAVIAVLRDTP